VQLILLTRPQIPRFPHENRAETGGPAPPPPRPIAAVTQM